MSGLRGAKAAPEAYEYLTVWDGGPGLTTYGAQRAGAVQSDMWEGVTAELEYGWRLGEKHVTRSTDSANPRYALNSVRRIVAYDTGALATPARHLFDSILTRRLRVTLLHSRRHPFPYCQTCGVLIAIPKGGGFRAAHNRRLVCHWTVCEKCFTRSRMHYGTWPGAARLGMPRPAPVHG